MPKIDDFGQDGLLSFWNSLSYDQRNELTKNLDEFTALISSLKGRGLIETDKYGQEITLLKKDPDVDALIAVHKRLKLPSIKLIKKFNK